MPDHPAIDSRDEHVRQWNNWLFTLAMFAAKQAAAAFAPTTKRRGEAHKLLLEAHFWHLRDGAGDEAAFAFAERLIEELRG